MFRTQLIVYNYLKLNYIKTDWIIAHSNHAGWRSKEYL